MTDEIRRAQRAELLLNDDLFKEAIKALSDKALEDFKAAKPSDTEALQIARVTYEVTERFVNIFTGYIRDGAYSKRKADEALKSKQPPKSHPAALQ